MSDPKPTPPKVHFHVSLFSKLRGYFLAGVLVTAPISITIYLTWAFLKLIDDNVRSIIPAQYYQDIAIPGLGVLIAVVFFMTMGWFAKNFLGRMIIRLYEYVLDKMPVIRTIYGGTKQIFETVMRGQSQSFRDVVMFEYPRTGIWTMGFIAGQAHAEIKKRISDDAVTVFLPTAPSPTNGILLFIPAKDLHILDISVEDAFKMILSGGILTGPSTLSNKKILSKGN